MYKRQVLDASDRHYRVKKRLGSPEYERAGGVTFSPDSTLLLVSWDPSETPRIAVYAVHSVKGPSRLPVRVVCSPSSVFDNWKTCWKWISNDALAMVTLDGDGDAAVACVWA